MKEALRSCLIDDSAVVALVSSRVAWGARPRAAALPSIVLHLIDSNPDYTMSGPSGLVPSRVQVDCWGATYASATNVSRAVKSALSGLRDTIDGVEFQGVFVVGERDLPDEGTDAEDIFHRVSLDFKIWHSD